MITKSFCRATITHCPTSSAAFASASRHASTPSVAATTFQRSRPAGATHQRRPSSSQASSPPGGHKPPPSDHAAPTPERRSPGRLTRRKSAKETNNTHSGLDAVAKAENQAFANAPSVPSTHHLYEADVKVSSFFALHRPISVTAAYPPTATNATFDSIFDSPSITSHRPADVIYTLQNAANALEGKSSNANWQSLQQVSGDSTHHLDGRPPIQPPQSIEQMVQQYRPFRPPPVPVPFDELEAQAVEQGTADRKRLDEYRARQMRAQDALSPGEKSRLDDIARKLQGEDSKRSFTTTLRIDETTHADGGKTYTASAGPVVEANAALENSPTIQLSRRKNEEERRKMYAISVKRQRKLKMKKHKYKKLMRRTRNLRIKQGRN